MLQYLADRVLDDDVIEIHELEVGVKVFGRPHQYDTGADNIVRVNASMLRKRLREYFESEGLHETVGLDIPRGNYAPIFQVRPKANVLAATEPFAPALELEAVPMQAAIQPLTQPVRPGWRMWALAALTVFFAATTLVLWLRPVGDIRQLGAKAASTNPAVRQFWGQFFGSGGAPVQIVLDDGAVDFYQEATARTIPLTEYFDRSYLGSVKDVSGANRLDPELMGAFVLRRQSSYGDTALLWKLGQISGGLKGSAEIRFARDLEFSQLKSGNVILLGNRQSNPWIQLFESSLGLRWRIDPELKVSYPQDSEATEGEQTKFRANAEIGKTHDGYSTVSLVRNLSGSGNVLIISGTGGTAVAAALDFLSDGPGMSDIAARLGVKGEGGFPPFEALLKIQKGIGLPRNTSIVTCRVLPVNGRAASTSARSSIGLSVQP
jgi:hypothetical protein